ncbi:hypothetical protein GF389_06320 [Candidatus Dojkabacteria bacterium]|nr:hypothetical protein [Candidatus Dojkabacteria bacterium]
MKQTTKPIYGIQGGKGSFNHQAFKSLDLAPNSYELKYLYTTKNVLEALKKGKIDYGLFAVRNTSGAEVQETAEVIDNYDFKLVQEVKIHISHHLMIKQEAKWQNITQIMTHPQVFKQCERNLEKKHPELKQTIGKGELIDNAKAAEAIATNEIGDSTAYLGAEILSEIYEMEIIERDLQDSKNNLTTFWLVSSS